MNSSLPPPATSKGALTASAEAPDWDERAMSACRRGAQLLRDNDPVAALRCYEEAAVLEPRYALAHQGRGHALHALQDSAGALDAFRSSLEAGPRTAGACVQIGFLCIQLSDYAAAANAFALAVQREPTNVDGLRGLAQCLFVVGDAENAVRAYGRLLEVAPELDYMAGERFHAQMYCCDWSAYEERRAAIAAAVRAGRRADIPGSFMCHSENPADQLACAKIFMAELCAARAPEPPASAHRPGPRIRVAYLSADFSAHATAYLAAGVFEAHDRNRFETHAFSFGPQDHSAMRARLHAAFENFHDVSGLTDEAIANELRRLDIDIAVDVKGHTLGARTRIFRLRAAPVQVSFLAYPGTMGVDFMDYLVADKVVIPEQDRSNYTEKIIYLPDCYQPNERARAPGTQRRRCDHGIADHSVVYCCFNSSYKITPPMFAAWMRILAAVPNSVLWLLDGPPIATRNLRGQAAAHGIDPTRLVFAPRVPAPDHWERNSLADVFLDTYPCNAHTTASDALWAGVPVVTMCGTTFTSRVATSLLCAVGLPQLSATTVADYERIAVQVGSDAAWRSQLRQVLSDARTGSTLFDPLRYARRLEAAYEAVVERARRGLRPETIVIAP